MASLAGSPELGAVASLWAAVSRGVNDVVYAFDETERRVRCCGCYHLFYRVIAALSDCGWVRPTPRLLLDVGAAWWSIEAGSGLHRYLRGCSPGSVPARSGFRSASKDAPPAIEIQASAGCSIWLRGILLLLGKPLRGRHWLGAARSDCFRGARSHSYASSFSTSAARIHRVPCRSVLLGVQ